MRSTIELMKVIDLTHTFDASMPVYPGDPHPQLSRIAEIGKEGFTDHELRTAMHVGTHMDAPLHMIEGGKYLSDISPEKFLGHGHLVDARGHDTLSVELIDSVSLKKIDILLFMT